MTVLARQPTGTYPPDAGAELDDASTHAPATRDWAGGGMALVPALLALLSLGAASVHFAVASDHFSLGWAHGSFFLAVGWLQLAWAAAVVMRPSRRVLLLGLLNAPVILIWILSRTVGLPLVPHGSEIEAWGVADVTCSAFEALIVVGSIAALARPALLRRRLSARPAAAIATAGLVVAGVSAIGLTPSFAGSHNHGAAGGAHVHAGAALDGSTPCEKSGAPASPAQVTDLEGHFHRGPARQIAIDQPTRVLLAQQQIEARAVAARYPTVADAERAGYRMSTPYVPCIGAHYTNFGLVGGFDPAAPSELLYDGTAEDSHIVGLSYLVFHRGGAPEGFAGPNDLWHQHNSNGGLCINSFGVVVGAEGVSPAQCQAAGGRKVPLPNVWMLHDWVVPGMECSWGTFAPECPELGGRVGGTAWDQPDPKSAATIATG